MIYQILATYVTIFAFAIFMYIVDMLSKKHSHDSLLSWIVLAMIMATITSGVMIDLESDFASPMFILGGLMFLGTPILVVVCDYFGQKIQIGRGK